MRYREVFSENRNDPLLHLRIKNYLNSLLKLGIEKRYAIGIIPLKSYEKGLVLFVAKTTQSQIIPKASKSAFTIAYPI